MNGLGTLAPMAQAIPGAPTSGGMGAAAIPAQPGVPQGMEPLIRARAKILQSIFANPFVGAPMPDDAAYRIASQVDTFEQQLQRMKQIAVAKDQQELLKKLSEMEIELEKTRRMVAPTKTTETDMETEPIAPPSQTPMSLMPGGGVPQRGMQRPVQRTISGPSLMQQEAMAKATPRRSLAEIEAEATAQARGTAAGAGPKEGADPLIKAKREVDATVGPIDDKIADLQKQISAYGAAMEDRYIQPLADQLAGLLVQKAKTTAAIYGKYGVTQADVEKTGSPIVGETEDGDSWFVKGPDGKQYIVPKKDYKLGDWQ